MSGTGKTASTEQIFVSILVFPPPVAGPFALPQGIQVVFPSLRAEGDRQGVSCNPFLLYGLCRQITRAVHRPFLFFSKGGKGLPPIDPKSAHQIYYLYYINFIIQNTSVCFPISHKKGPCFPHLAKGCGKPRRFPLSKKREKPALLPLTLTARFSRTGAAPPPRPSAFPPVSAGGEGSGSALWSGSLPRLSARRCGGCDRRGAGCASPGSLN